MKSTVITFVIISALCVCIGLLLGYEIWHPSKPSCTHGVSSVGPVTIRNGKIYGNTTPHTETCLP